MLDDGVGPAVYDELCSSYIMPDEVTLFDVGCMSLDHISVVDDYDLIITVDALDDTGGKPGTLYRFTPDDMARRSFGSQSLHDLKLSDLFDSAALLGYVAEGVCLGMQVDNGSPAQATVGLTPAVYDSLGGLVDCVLAELVHRGYSITLRADGSPIHEGYHHVLKPQNC
jgi:hydrogenase maturation protease